MLRDVVAQGPSKSRRIKTFTAVFSQSNAQAQVNGPQNRGFPRASKLQWGYGHVTEKRR